MLDQIVRDVHHDVVVAPHGSGGERRPQQIVGALPVGLMVVGGEQAVGTDVAEALDARRQELLEAVFVAQIADHVGTRGEDEAFAENVALEHRSEPGGQSGRILDRRARVDADDVAQYRQSIRRMR